ncbi:quaternary amine ABC transporter ATP-binding protein [Marisediminicola antarctica]|uniref:Glycine betaine ABC transporter ATP-binding protein n=1 Tax=Marisediminicola antarctica TaxID=674079 RepID=A0A7L5AI78_9MICO|nr:glycine betaine/L-proline ABC transporter ATP-binding protein [Marisediminicola antarctica]QHO69752.1 glycine betaine ABC transporter ATP-binding protein [Marisediminicola antarctica]
MSSTSSVSVKNLYKVFGRRPKDAVKKLQDGVSRSDLGAHETAAVIDASFEVKKGEIFVVMGLSGSGKSTLIRTLNGLLDPTSGSVTVNGIDISDVSPAKLREVRQKNVSMVFQHFALFPHRTVLDNAAYGLEVQGIPRAERLERALKIVNIVGLDGWADKYPSELSGGMQQRVGLARALATETDIMLMDEAFSALDPLIRREMQEQLLELQAELGKTIIFITHDLNEAMFLGDRIAVMRDGRIVQIGTPEDILTDPANDYVAQFVQDVDRARVLTAATVMEPARAVVPLTAGPRGALRVMRDLQAGAAFVLGRDLTLLGVVTDRHVMRQVKSNETDLSLVINQEHASVPADAALVDLFELAVESPLPIAVIDDKRRLLGVIPRITLLAALGNVPTNTTPINIIEPVSIIPDAELDAMLASPEPTPAAASTEGTLA